jgi:hypothetical protein
MSRILLRLRTWVRDWPGPYIVVEQDQEAKKAVKVFKADV